MISFTNITKTFGKTIALRGVSFSIPKGEVVGLLGPNGAGKTTTMRIIVGYLKPTKGGVRVINCDPIEERVEVLTKIGYLPENNPLYEDMKVSEYLDFIGSVKDVDKKHINKIVDDTGVGTKLHVKIEELSRGYRQRVGLAASLIGNPDILILDEPTSGLDPIEQEKIRTLIKKLGKEKTVILSTHILSEAEDVSTRLIIINKGHIVYDGKKPKGKGAVKKLFTSRVLIGE